MAQQYTNIRLLADRLKRHPLLQDLNFETIVDYTVNFMQLVGVPSMFEEKTAILKIDNYRALLPCDYYQMIQVRQPCGIAYRYSTDSFHMSENKGNYQDLTYKIQGGVIFTSTKDSNIEIAYKAVAVDEEGYPLLIDNSSFTRALEYYIKMRYFEILFDMGKIQPQVFQNVQQQYAWAVGDCQTEFNRLTIDEMEAFTNSWNTLIQRANEHSYGFKNNGTKERIKLQ